MTDMTGTVELYYEERGQGLPVVLLHGFPFDHRIWQAQQDALSDAYRIITPDLRGHGQSPVPEGDYSMETLAADVVALLDRLGIDQAVWVGHSMGGYVTMAALRTSLTRIRAVAFVATQPYADSDERRFNRLQSADNALLHGSRDTAFSMMGILFSPQVEGKSPLAQGIYEIMVNTPPIGLAGALRGMAARPDSVETLQKLTLPTLVIGAEDDQLIKPEIAGEMAQLIPGARLVEIPNSGHLPMVEQPGATTDALRAFLKSLGGTA